MNDFRQNGIIRVLIVDDSPVVQTLLKNILGADPKIDVVGAASNGEEALSLVKQCSPNVITMDYHMPKMNGLEATRKIMETHPLPIILVSGTLAREEAVIAFRIMESGAVAIIDKPLGRGHSDHDRLAKELVQTVKSMAEVKVIRYWPKSRMKPTLCTTQKKPLLDISEKVRLVGIGASTGGPVVIKTILEGIPKNFPVPILIVQHIAQGFTQGFVEWLVQTTGFSVQIASTGTVPLPGQAYVAPEGSHMQLSHNGSIILNDNAAVNGHRPSVSMLFRSIASVFGENALGILLTGMGKDGAAELKLMKNKGAQTITQDEASCVVYGMPKEALDMDAATWVLSPEEISAALATLSRR